jgi:DNA repair exonuclease SbcCD nuclease subunit
MPRLPTCSRDDIAYVALGHLHKPQNVDRQTIRYSARVAPIETGGWHLGRRALLW